MQLEGSVRHILLLRGATGAGKSAAARWLCAHRPGVSLIEIDDIRIRKYGSTAICDPPVNFPEAGRAASDEFAAGHDVIVAEAFCDRQHLDWVLGPMDLTLDSPQVSVVWLECGAGTSLARKGRVLAPEVIRIQHGRYSSRFCFPGEALINTDALSIEQIARQILAATSFGRPSGSRNEARRD